MCMFTSFLFFSRSQDFKCPTCGSVNNTLKPVTDASKKTTEEAKELASQIDFKVCLYYYKHMVNEKQ